MKVILLLILLLPSAGYSDDFFNTHEKGWFWYEKIPEKSKKEKTQPLSQEKHLSASQSMAALQKQVGESLHRAILSPTEKNLMDYANKYHQVIHQGQAFTDGYKRMLLKYPQYDYYLRFPVNHQARLIQERQRNQAQQAAAKKLSNTHGLLFVYSSDCPYCQVFAPTAKQFAERYRFHVMPISMDGKGLPEYPQPLPNNGIVKNLNITSWPALFLVNPKTHQVTPLSYGMVSISELEETLFTYAETA